MTSLTILLAALLLLDAVLHGLVVHRFGARQNVAYLVFAVVYAVLGLAVLTASSLLRGFEPAVLWIALIATTIGLAALTWTFRQIARDKSLDKAIWVVDAAIVVLTAILLFSGGA